MFRKFTKIIDEAKKKQKELVDQFIEGGKKPEGPEDSSGGEKTKSKKKFHKTYYLLYKETRNRYFSKLENYKYSQVRGFIEQTYLPKLMTLDNFDLKALQSVFPIPLVFITPRKKAIAVFAIYSGAIAEEKYKHEPPATYKEFAKYFKIRDPLRIRQYVKGRLLMYRTVTPFRRVAGLKVGRNSNARIVDGELLNFAMRYTTPSGVFKDLYKLAREDGIREAIKFAYTFTHGADRLSSALSRDADQETIERILVYIMKKRMGEVEDLDYLPKPKPIEAPSSVPPPPGTTQGTETPKAGISIKFCPNCGAEIPPNAKFCPMCGFDLTKLQ